MALKLQTNVPQTIALAFADGLTVASNFGNDQVMFTLTNGEKLYLPPIVAKKIADAGIQAGKPFAICKRELTQGNRRMIEYQIEPAEVQESSAGVVAFSVTGAAAAAAANQPRQDQSSSTRNGLHALESANGKTVAVAPIDPPVTAEEQFGRAFCSAVDIALATISYAKTRGMLLTPTFEDVRAMAATLHISAQRGGAR